MLTNKSKKGGVEVDKSSINKPLIIFSAFVSVILMALSDAGSQVKLTSFADYVGTIVIVLIAYPFIAMWFKAIWNEIAYKIFNLPIINGWQAAGILVFLFLLLG